MWGRGRGLTELKITLIADGIEILPVCAPQPRRPRLPWPDDDSVVLHGFADVEDRLVRVQIVFCILVHRVHVQIIPVLTIPGGQLFT